LSLGPSLSCSSPCCRVFRSRRPHHHPPRNTSSPLTVRPTHDTRILGILDLATNVFCKKSFQSLVQFPSSFFFFSLLIFKDADTSLSPTALLSWASESHPWSQSYYCHSSSSSCNFHQGAPLFSFTNRSFPNFLFLFLLLSFLCSSCLPTPLKSC